MRSPRSWYASTMPTARRIRVTGAALAACATLAVSACGSSGNGATTNAATVSNSAQGVSSTSITLGVATANVSNLATLGPTYNVGNEQSYWNAILAMWKKKGITPIDGRNIKLDFTNYLVIAANPAQSQRNACVTLTQDDKVFAVAADADFTDGEDCVAGQNHVPILTASDSVSDPSFKLDSPYLFSIGPSLSRTLRNLPYWMKQEGLLGPKVVLGTYHLGDPVTTALVDSTLKASLSKLGKSLAVEATTSDELGSPADEAAVERMKAAGVNTVILLDATNAFLNAANRLNYHPKYVASDYLGVATGSAIAPFPANQLNGTYAMTSATDNDWTSNIPPSAAAEQCIQAYAAYSGTTLVPQGNDAGKYTALLSVCDDANTVLKTLQTAGKNVTRASYISAMQSIKNLSGAEVPSISFSATSHAGGTEVESLKWAAACTCYHVVKGFQQFPVS
jgi:hypothetical protein